MTTITTSFQQLNTRLNHLTAPFGSRWWMLAVLLIAALVFALSFKLRRREFATLEDVGISRTTLNLVKLFEIVIVGLAAAVVVLAAWWIVREFGVGLVRLGLR